MIFVVENSITKKYGEISLERAHELMIKSLDFYEEYTLFSHQVQLSQVEALQHYLLIKNELIIKNHCL